MARLVRILFNISHVIKSAKTARDEDPRINPYCGARHTAYGHRPMNGSYGWPTRNPPTAKHRQISTVVSRINFEHRASTRLELVSRRLDADCRRQPKPQPHPTTTMHSPFTAAAARVTRELHGVVVSAGLMEKTVKVRVGGRKWNSIVNKVCHPSPVLSSC